MLKTTWKSKYQRYILIHENAPIHRTMKCLDCMRDDDFIHAFLPPYNLESAEVELFFSQIKSRIKRNKQKYLINLRGDEGVQLIAKELLKLERKKIIRLWRHSFSQMRQDLKYIIEYLVMINMECLVRPGIANLY